MVDVERYVYLRGNDKGLVIATFKVSPDLLDLLDVYALKHHLNRSEAIRKAILEMIQSADVKKARVEPGIRLK